MSGLKNLTTAIRAPFMVRHGLASATFRNGLDYAYDNAFTLRWRNAADTADVDVLAVDSSNRVAPQGAFYYGGLTPAAVTTGSIISTGTSWVAHSTAGACGIKLLLSNTCNTGEFATLRMRARADNTTASGNGGNSVGTTTAGDFSASANTHDFGNLFAVNACAQPNAKNQTTDATNVVCALYGRIDATGTSLGRRWVSWIDTHATTKSAAGDYMVRISHNGTIANDGCFTIYNGGRMPVLFNFEDAAGFLTDADASKTTAAGALAVKTPAGTKYIVLYT